MLINTLFRWMNQKLWTNSALIVIQESILTPSMRHSNSTHLQSTKEIPKSPTKWPNFLYYNWFTSVFLKIACKVQKIDKITKTHSQFVFLQKIPICNFSMKYLAHPPNCQFTVLNSFQQFPLWKLKSFCEFLLQYKFGFYNQWIDWNWVNLKKCN